MYISAYMDVYTYTFVTYLLVCVCVYSDLDHEVAGSPGRIGEGDTVPGKLL